MHNPKRTLVLLACGIVSMLLPVAYAAAKKNQDKILIREEPHAPGDIVLVSMACDPERYSIRPLRVMGSRIGPESIEEVLKYETKRQPLLAEMQEDSQAVFLNGRKVTDIKDAHMCHLPQDIEVTTEIDFKKPFVFEESGSLQSGLTSVMTKSPVLLKVIVSDNVVATIPDAFSVALIEISSEQLRICKDPSRCSGYSLQDLRRTPLESTGMKTYMIY